MSERGGRDPPHLRAEVASALCLAAPTLVPTSCTPRQAYDHNKVDSVSYATGIYNDSRANAAVDGFAVHW